jgi:hypothetical protein
MFYFSRHFIAGTDPERQARFNAAWQFPEVRFCHRLITTVWGCVFVGELIIRLALINRLPAALVLVISPILLGVLTIVTMIWAFRYGHQVRLRALARFNQLEIQNPSNYHKAQIDKGHKHDFAEEGSCLSSLHIRWVS